ncbi:hypothetical protein N8590_01595 [bacterium]|nr:hypothetical protein [bacterium]MDB4793028.1 hypothetical protein [bacterium]
MPTFNHQSAKRIANVVRHVERTPINGGAGKRTRRQPTGGNRSKFFRVRKHFDGAAFVDFRDYHSLDDNEKYYFQCAETNFGSQNYEQDEEEWVNVYNLANEWIPLDTVLQCWNVKGEWFTYFRRELPPTIICTGTATVPDATYGNITMEVGTCSLGKIQYEIDDGVEVGVSAINHCGRYIDAGFNVVAIGYSQSTSTRYLDKSIDLYGDDYTTVLSEYEFVLIEAGCS